MRLPSYLTLGGVGTHVKGVAEQSTTGAGAKMTLGVAARLSYDLIQHTPDLCTVWNPNAHSMSYGSFSLLRNADWSCTLNWHHALSILHYKTKASYDNAKATVEGYSKDSTGHPSGKFYTKADGSAWTAVQICVNYCDARQEIAVLQADYANEYSFVKFPNSSLSAGVDRLTLCDLSDEAAAKVASVPYGKK